VSQKNPDIPVFTVRSGDIEKTLHRNLLYLLDLHEDEVDEADDDEQDEAADADKHADVDEDKKKDVIWDEDEVERDVTGISEDSDNDDGEDGVAIITRPPGDARCHIDVDVSHGGEEELKVPEVEPEDTRVEEKSVGQDVEQDVLTDDADDEEAVRTVDKPEIDQEDETTAGEDDDKSEVRDEQERRPVLTPRRSTRQRRQPDRYGHNIMSAVQMESTDD